MNREEMQKAIKEEAYKELVKLLGHAITSTYKWITADELVTPKPCILSYIILTAKDNACTLTIHDGVDTNGRVVAILETTAAQSRPFSFHGEALLQHGLYVNLSGDVLGIFICWHDVPTQVGG